MSKKSISIGKAVALGTLITFTGVFSAEGLHCVPMRSMIPTFVHPCWSMTLPPHVSATALNMGVLSVLSLPISR
jgi:hypothetical protein